MKLLRQGCLLDTPTTRRWTPEQRLEADYQEKCCAFKDFHYYDLGKGRTLVKKFDTPQECAIFVKKWNDRQYKKKNS